MVLHHEVLELPMVLRGCLSAQVYPALRASRKSWELRQCKHVYPR